MTEFARTFDSADAHDIIDCDAAFTLVLRSSDGRTMAVDSNEMPALKDEGTAIDKAIFALSEADDRCDVYWYGEYHGTARYADMAPSSWFSRMEAVFSMPL